MPSTHSTQTHKHTKVYICTWLWPEYTFGEWVEMEKRSDFLYHQHSQVQWNFCLHLILSFYFGSPMFIQLGVRIIMWCAGRHSQYSTHIYLYIVIIIIIIISIRQERIVSIDCMEILIRLVIVCKFIRYQIGMNGCVPLYGLLTFPRTNRGCV